MFASSDDKELILLVTSSEFMIIELKISILFTIELLDTVTISSDSIIKLSLFLTSDFKLDSVIDSILFFIAVCRSFKISTLLLDNADTKPSSINSELFLIFSVIAVDMSLSFTLFKKADIFLACSLIICTYSYF